MASLDSKIKTANILGKVVGKADKLVNQGFIPDVVNYYGLTRDIGGMAFKHIKKNNTFGLGQAVTGIENKFTNKIKSLPKPIQSGLKTFDKAMDFGFNKVQLPIGMASLGLNLTGLGGSKEQDVAMEGLAEQKSLQKIFTPPKQTGFLKELRKKGSEDNLPSPSINDDGYWNNKLDALIRRRHGLEDLNNLSSVNLRDADIFEIPYLIDICNFLKDKFLITTPKDYKMLVDRMYGQNTLIDGDLRDLKGFINYGFREIRPGQPKIKYIRIVYTSPEHRGEGLSRKIIESILQPEEPVWMQVCHDNYPMLKMASKMGFTHFDTWNYNGNTSELWGRNIDYSKTKTANEDFNIIVSPME